LIATRRMAISFYGCFRGGGQVVRRNAQEAFSSKDGGSIIAGNQ
jgi:hypothetical protein